MSAVLRVMCIDICMCLCLCKHICTYKCGRGYCEDGAIADRGKMRCLLQILQVDARTIELAQVYTDWKV